jgi:small subunit ribosomal protein S27Ae
MAAAKKDKEKKKGKSDCFEVSGAGAKRKKRNCPKCGPGVFMAEHKNRYSCGKCSFTEMK